MIFVEGDTGVARMFCGCCNSTFRAYLDRVTTANKRPICKTCIEYFNPRRVEIGLPPMPFDRTAYLPL